MVDLINSVQYIIRQEEKQIKRPKHYHKNALQMSGQGVGDVGREIGGVRSFPPVFIFIKMTLLHLLLNFQINCIHFE